MMKLCNNVLTAIALMPYLAIAQDTVKHTDLRLQRADVVKAIQSQLIIKNTDDVRRVTKEYLESRIAKIRILVQDQMLETLGQSDKQEDVRNALAVIVGKMNGRSDASAPPFVYVADLKGLKVVVIGYDLAFGGAIPETRVVIEAYRKAGAVYELAAQTGDALKNCGLVLEQLNSPRENEAWFFAHGQLFGPMDYQEVVRLYSFDGYQFKELWAPSKTKFSPNYLITSDTVTLTYFSEFLFDDLYHKRQERLQDTIRLTSGGPVVSTVRLPQ